MEDIMSEFKSLISKIFEDTIQKAVFSNPEKREAEFKKITISRMPKFYQVTKFTEKQVFHENLDFDKIAERCLELAEYNFTTEKQKIRRKENLIILKINLF